MNKFLASVSVGIALVLSSSYLPASAIEEESAVLSAGTRSVSEVPGYYPTGPQNDVAISSVLAGGWEICYEGKYEEDNVPLYGRNGILTKSCTGDYLMLAGYFSRDSSNFAVLAAAPREDVIQDVGVGADAYHTANGTRWYFSPEWSWGFVSEEEVPNRESCDFDRDFSRKTLCWHTEDEYGFMNGGYLLAGVDSLNNSSDAFRVVLQFGAKEQTATPYTGPRVINTPVATLANGSVTLTGSQLASVTSVSVAGKGATIVSQSESSITINLPQGIGFGLLDVELTYGDGESVTLQNAVNVQDGVRGWTKAQSDGTVKIYAKGLLAKGKIQFFHNGREVAWVRALDSMDPKLSFANGSDYLVRTRELVDGKNSFEIYQDGERILRVAYTG